MLCIIYVIAISSCLYGVGLLAELAVPASWARRWTWLGAILLSVLIPAVYRVKHNTMMHTASTMYVSSHDRTVGQAIVVAMWLSMILALAHALRVSYLIHTSRRGSAVIDGVSAVVTDSAGPATVGVMRARVIVPRWVLALSSVEQRYIMRHESEHRGSRDTLVLFIASLAVIMGPWNLPIWWQLRRLRLAIEMDCDKRVVRALGDARAYGRMLLRVAEAGSRSERSLQPALLGAGMLERRITALVAPRVRTIGMRVLAASFASILLYVVIMMPHPVAH